MIPMLHFRLVPWVALKTVLIGLVQRILVLFLLVVRLLEHEAALVGPVGAAIAAIHGRVRVLLRSVAAAMLVRTRKVFLSSLLETVLLFNDALKLRFS